MTKIRLPVKEKALTRLVTNSPFLRQVQEALDVSADKLAAICGENSEAVEALLKRGRISELPENDELYERLLAYVNERIGMGIAVRNELMSKLARDRAARLARRAAIKG